MSKTSTHDSYYTRPVDYSAITQECIRLGEILKEIRDRNPPSCDDTFICDLYSTPTSLIETINRLNRFREQYYNGSRGFEVMNGGETVMSRTSIPLIVQDNGSIIIPPAAAATLGYRPGDSIALRCPDAEGGPTGTLYLCQQPPDTEAITITGDSTGLPPEVFLEAGIPHGAAMSAFVAGEALVLVRAEEAELPVESIMLLNELGISSLTASMVSEIASHYGED